MKRSRISFYFVTLVAAVALVAFTAGGVTATDITLNDYADTVSPFRIFEDGKVYWKDVAADDAKSVLVYDEDHLLDQSNSVSGQDTGGDNLIEDAATDFQCPDLSSGDFWRVYDATGTETTLIYGQAGGFRFFQFPISIFCILTMWQTIPAGSLLMPPVRLLMINRRSQLTRLPLLPLMMLTKTP